VLFWVLQDSAVHQCGEGVALMWWPQSSWFVCVDICISQEVLRVCHVSFLKHRAGVVQISGVRFGVLVHGCWPLFQAG
jgi:hypothetical protein